MPWTLRNYPEDMRNLPANVRAKAIEIANELVEEGKDEAPAARAAIGRAKRWGARQAKLGRMKKGKAPARRRRRETQRGRRSRRVSHASDFVGSR